MTRLPLALLLIAAPAAAFDAPGCLHDPVVTHTNGMRIASTTSLRSHNVYWQCQDGRHGYCDGQLHSPCRDELRTLGTRCHGRFVPPYTPMGPTSSRAPRTLEGLETADGESLGFLGARTPGAAPAAAAQAADGATPDDPTSLLEAATQQAQEAGQGETWLNALQTISRKIATPEN